MDLATVSERYARPFPGCSYVARVVVVHGDRAFQPGELYPYADLGQHETIAIGMWKSGMLSVAPGTPATVAFTASPAESIAITPPPRPAPPSKHHRR